MTRLIQIQKGRERAVALVEEPRFALIGGFKTVYDLALAAVRNGSSLSAVVRKNLSRKSLEYGTIYRGKSDWLLLVPVDHPTEPARCLVCGTGLTHFGSAKNRNAMHQSKAKKDLTDSMRMFRPALKTDAPKPGHIGIAPEWFYKGPGTILRAPGEPLIVPAYADDGGEEAEMVGVYLVDSDGNPGASAWRPATNSPIIVLKRKIT